MSRQVWWGNRYRIDIGVCVLGEIGMGGSCRDTYLGGVKGMTVNIGIGVEGK